VKKRRIIFRSWSVFVFFFWLRDCKVMYFEVGGRTLGYPGEREWGVDLEQQSNCCGERNAWAIYEEMEKEL
jgi:hypothetical protein